MKPEVHRQIVLRIVQSGLGVVGFGALLFRRYDGARIATDVRYVMRPLEAGGRSLESGY